MIIHPVNRQVTETSCTLTTKIECEHAIRSCPEALWFTFPLHYKDTLSTNHDGFLIPLVSVAMFHKENIHVKGAVSDTLLYAMETYQQVLCFWHPEFFSRITITSDSITKPVSKSPQGTMCTYTGGIDSTYTLWSHLPKNELDRNYNITHALYITELGLQEENEETVSAKVSSFSALTSSLDIAFISVETNAKKFQQFGHQTPMYMSDASLILGPVAFFENIVRNFLFSSDATHDFEILEIINHTLVPLLATADMNVRVHGASVSRMEKLRSLAKWPAVHGRLVSCWKNPNQLQNCGTCYKCCYTMAAIELENLVGVFKTYPKKIDRPSMRSCRAEKGLTFILEKWISLAWQRKKWSIAIDYTWALWVSRLHIFLEDFGLSALRRPINILYILSATLRKRSSTYSYLLDRIKESKSIKI